MKVQKIKNKYKEEPKNGKSKRNERKKREATEMEKMM